MGRGQGKLKCVTFTFLKTDDKEQKKLGERTPPPSSRTVAGGPWACAASGETVTFGPRRVRGVLGVLWREKYCPPRWQWPQCLDLAGKRSERVGRLSHGRTPKLRGGRIGRGEANAPFGTECLPLFRCGRPDRPHEGVWSWGLQEVT